jgi:hypothetical protein
LITFVVAGSDIVRRPEERARKGSHERGLILKVNEMRNSRLDLSRLQCMHGYTYA